MNQISDRPGPSWNVGMLLSGIALLVGIATLIPFPDVIRRMFGSEEKFRRKTEELRKEAEVRADEWEKTFDKIEALKSSRIRFTEISIQYSSRLGEIKLNPWRDGFYNLFFLVKKRFSRGVSR